MPLSNVIGASSILKPGVCTSSTRPASPYDGQVIYETDTNLTLVYEGSEWAVLNQQVFGSRNVVINGAMQVAQRGTSTAGITTSGYFTADRWRVNYSSLGTWTQSVENDAPTGSGLRQSLKMLCTTANAAPAAGDVLFMQYRFEGQNVQQFLKGTASAKSFMLTFWVKSNVTGTFIAEVADVDNTRQVSKSYTISASETWEKKTIDFGADTTGVFDNDNAGSLFLNFHMGAGTNYTSGTLNTNWATTVTANRVIGQVNVAAATNNYFQITGVQLEAGSVATPFEFEDYGTTLAKCQRYYWRLVEGSGAERISVAAAHSSSDARAVITFPTTMRTSPTLEIATGAYYSFERNNADDDITSLTIAQASKSSCLIYNNTEISSTAGHAGNFRATSASARLSFTAEL